MDWKKFDYTQSLHGSSSIIARPLIEIIVSNKAGSVRTMAMIDSGTDTAVFNAQIAEALYIKPNTCEAVSLSGIGDKRGFRCGVTITIPSLDFSSEWPVVFAEDTRFDALLGQTHFFQNFHVRFEKNKNAFYLAKV